MQNLHNVPKFDAAFGLDICGYGRLASLAFAKRIGDEKISVVLFDHFPFCGFSEKNVGNTEICAFADTERRFLNTLPSLGVPLFIDVPIDLQGLDNLHQRNVRWVWQLSQRSIDRALGAQAPLASYLGIPTARFWHAFGRIDNLRGDAQAKPSSRIEAVLGAHVFETYPKASLKLSQIKSNHNLQNVIPQSYKFGRATVKSSTWVPDPHAKGNFKTNPKVKDGQDSAARNIALAGLGTNLRIKTEGDLVQVNDDDLDAVICALTGVIGGLSKTRLEQLIQSKLFKDIEYTADCGSIPRGYFITENFWGSKHPDVFIRREHCFFQWVQREFRIDSQSTQLLPDCDGTCF